MEVLLGSPKSVKRTKGLRSVKKEQNKSNIGNSESAHNKLFNCYLMENPKSPFSIYKLGNRHQYYSDLLNSKKELQYMNMILLSQVLLYLNKFNKLLDEGEILIYINNLIGKNKDESGLIKFIIETKDEEKAQREYSIIRQKITFEFLKYIRFVKILVDQHIINDEIFDTEAEYSSSAEPILPHGLHDDFY